MSIRLLALHAPYKCRHRGVCCREPWAIPVDRVRRARVVHAVHAGRLHLPHGDRALFAAAPGVDSDADVVVGRRGRECVFLESGQVGRCAIHRDLGHEALPTACQHFPRVVVLDPRGVSMSLSYVCPTAADLLHDASPGWHEVVHQGPVVRPDVAWEGLDARDTLPPQVSDRLLWDWEAMTAFELGALSALSRLAPERALALIDRVAWRLESEECSVRLQADSRQVRLKPDAPVQSLTPLVTSAFRESGEDVHGAEVDVDALARLAAQCSTGPVDEPASGHRSGESAEIWRRHTKLVARYLASRTIASAVVYHARSARVWSGWLQTAYAVLRRSVDLELRTGAADRTLVTAALARADRLLVHGIDAGRLATALHARPALPS